MKKIAFIILSCCVLLCTGCKKDKFETHKYKASFEYHIANANNQASVETLINNWDAVWKSEIELTLLNIGTTDAEAYTKFEASVLAVDVMYDAWNAFMSEDDYMIYTLERTTPGYEKQLRRVRFDTWGHVVL